MFALVVAQRHASSKLIWLTVHIDPDKADGLLIGVLVIELREDY